jgi:di/tricarboxylate transporter
MLTGPQILLSAIVLAALALVMSGRVRADLVALLVLLALPVAQLVTPAEALAGLSNPAILTLVGLFMLSHALEESGAAQKLASAMRRAGGQSEARLVLLFMGAGAVLSLAMNNVAAGAVLLPVAIQVADDSGVPASRLLIPLSFGTMVGGMATYFTTANIVISGVLVSSGLPGLGMADFLPTGGLIALGCIAGMVWLGRRLLPRRPSVGQEAGAASLSRALAQTYQLDERLWEMRLLPTSRLADQPISASGIGHELGLMIIAIWRNHHAILNPDPAELLRPGDYLLIMGREDRVKELQTWGFALGRDPDSRWAQQLTVDLTEVIIPPRSQIIGQSLQDLRFRDKYGLTCVALWREGRSYRTDVGKFRLQVGDALLMVGNPARIARISRDPDFLVMRSAHQARPRRPEKMGVVLAVTLMALLASVLELAPISLAMLGGALAVVLLGGLDMDDAYRAVEWRVLFLIAGFLPLSTALINTGLAESIGGTLVSVFGSLGALGFASGVFLVAMAITQVVGSQVAALIIAPIAVASAQQLGISPQTIGLAAAIGCSAAFLTPMSHAVNVLMMGPGGYRPGDFPRVGALMLAITFGMLLLGLVLFRGF